MDNEEIVVKWLGYMAELLQKAVPEAQVKAVTLLQYTDGSHLRVHSRLPDYWHLFRTKYPHCTTIEGYSEWRSYFDPGPEFRTKKDLILWLCRVLKVPDSVVRMLLLAV